MINLTPMAHCNNLKCANFTGECACVRACICVSVVKCKMLRVNSFRTAFATWLNASTEVEMVFV